MKELIFETKVGVVTVSVIELPRGIIHVQSVTGPDGQPFEAANAAMAGKELDSVQSVANNLNLVTVGKWVPNLLDHVLLTPHIPEQWRKKAHQALAEAAKTGISQQEYLDDLLDEDAMVQADGSLVIFSWSKSRRFRCELRVEPADWSWVSDASQSKSH